jgi:hypothetical protein
LFGAFTKHANTATTKLEIFPWLTTGIFLFAEAPHRNIRSSVDQPFFATSEPPPPRIAK